MGGAGALAAVFALAKIEAFERAVDAEAHRSAQAGPEIFIVHGGFRCSGLCGTCHLPGVRVNWAVRMTGVPSSLK